MYFFLILGFKKPIVGAKTPQKQQPKLEISEKVKSILNVGAKVSAETKKNQTFTLFEHGVQVVRNEQLIALLPQIRADMHAEMLRMPEYKNVAKMLAENTDFVLGKKYFFPKLKIIIFFYIGGFAAFGTSSSVHNTTVRDLREWCFNALSKPLSTFSAEINKKRVSENLEPVEFCAQSVIDRFMFRRKGKETASETFHRDVGIFCDEFRQMPHFVFGIYFFFKFFFLNFLTLFFYKVDGSILTLKINFFLAFLAQQICNVEKMIQLDLQKSNQTSWRKTNCKPHQLWCESGKIFFI